jgi:hypothetical protein
MRTLFYFPGVVFILSVLLLWVSTRCGVLIATKTGRSSTDDRGDLELITGASLTLLGLIIGFSFSMAVSRYDQRKDYEEEEANAIGTEYVRADLLAAADAAQHTQPTEAVPTAATPFLHSSRSGRA